MSSNFGDSVLTQGLGLGKEMLWPHWPVMSLSSYVIFVCSCARAFAFD